MIKLKIALGSTDEKYANRLADYISLHYGDRIELYFFGRTDLLADFLEKNRVNGVFVEADFLSVQEALSGNTVFACLSDGMGAGENQKFPVLMKYQHADALIKEMMSLCSEQISQLHTGSRTEGRGSVLLFESPAGGVGTTTLACACAYYLKHQGQKVLYLNMERFGAVGPFFGGEGRLDLGDLLYALKSRRGNFAIKLESVVRQDISGVSYVEPCRHADDVEGIHADDSALLVQSVIDSGMYETVIIDRNSGLTDVDYELRRLADQILMVSDGSEKANEKLEKLYEAVKIYEKNEEVLLTSKVKLLYNRFGSHTGSRLELSGVETLGGFPRYENLTESAIVEQMAEKNLFQKLI